MQNFPTTHRIARTKAHYCRKLQFVRIGRRRVNSGKRVIYHGTNGSQWNAVRYYYKYNDKIIIYHSEIVAQVSIEQKLFWLSHTLAWSHQNGEVQIYGHLSVILDRGSWESTYGGPSVFVSPDLLKYNLDYAKNILRLLRIY